MVSQPFILSCLLCRLFAIYSASRHSCLPSYGYKADLPPFRGLVGVHQRRHLETGRHDGIVGEALKQLGNKVPHWVGDYVTEKDASIIRASSAEIFFPSI